MHDDSVRDRPIFKEAEMTVLRAALVDTQIVTAWAFASKVK